MTTAVELEVGALTSTAPEGFFYTPPAQQNACLLPVEGSMWVCTRAIHEDGYHVAADGFRVLATHRVEGPVLVADPWLGRIPAIGGDTAGLDQVNDNTNGLRTANLNWCNRSNPNYGGGNGVCTRANGHPANWACVSTSGSGRNAVLWTEVLTVGGVARGTLSPEQASHGIPDDGSPLDPEDLVLDHELEAGEVVRAKHRATLLYVLSRRSNGDIEALDLTSQAMLPLVIAPKWLVPTDYVPTLENLKYIGEWFAADRKRARDIAVREYLNGRWCMDGLNEQLKVMGLPRYEPLLRGEIVVSLPFTHENSKFGKSDIEKTFRDVDVADIVAKFKEAALKDPDLTFSDELGEIKASDLGRR